MAWKIVFRMEFDEGMKALRHQRRIAEGLPGIPIVVINHPCTKLSLIFHAGVPRDVPLESFWDEVEVSLEKILASHT